MAILLLPDLLAAIAADPQKLRDFCANKASKLKGELPQLAGNDYKLTEYLVTKPILTRELLEYYTS
jgi:hypothetical protein